jgi:large subunit ribosomal protein L18
MPHQLYGSRYRVPLRRRREKKTDYQARKGFVVSGKPRLVARSSLKNTIAQIIVAKPQGDQVLAAAHTHELIKKYGWKAATGNIPAAYLTGLLCGLKAKKNGVSEAILDLGLVSPTKSAKVFATMSGVVDAGVTIPHSEEKIVKDRNRGYHIQDYAENLGAPAEYAPKFSTLKAKGLAPEKFSDHFFEVRNAILTEFGMPIPKPEPRAAKPKPKPAPASKLVPKPAAKPEVKPVIVEAKPAAAEAKPAIASAKAPEAKKPEAAEVKSKHVEAKPEVAAPAPKAEPAPKVKAEAEEKLKAVKPKAKPAAKKAAPAKAKAAKAAKAEKVEEAKVEAEPVEKPKRATRKKPEAKEEKPAKKTGGKKA